jgi:hypothetical protein
MQLRNVKYQSCNFSFPNDVICSQRGHYELWFPEGITFHYPWILPWILFQVFGALFSQTTDASRNVDANWFLSKAEARDTTRREAHNFLKTNLQYSPFLLNRSRLFSSRCYPLFTMASKEAIDKARGKLLQSAADEYAVNPGPQDLKSVAMDAGFKGIEGKAFRLAVKSLKEDGWLNRSKDIITWTDKGIARFPEAKAPPTQEERQAMFFEKLCKNPENYPGGLPSESQSKIIFDMLLDREFTPRKSLSKLRAMLVRITRSFATS